MKPSPPRKALQFLRWFCRRDCVEEIEGNLIELYRKQLPQHSRHAKWNFCYNVLLHFRPAFIRPIKGAHYLSHSGMLESYFKIGWRSLVKQKSYSSINIGGLAVGLTCFILIFSYIRHELSFDNFYDNNGQIYRIYQRQPGNTHYGTEFYAYTTVGLAPALRDEFPEVSQATTIRDQTALLSYSQHHFYENGLRADAHFFSVFQLPFIHGNPLTALQKRESIVLTTSLARKIFGNEDPMGKVLIFHNDETLVVTGVMEDLPTNSSIQFTFITPMTTSSQYVREMNGDRWNNNDYYTFCALAGGANPRLFQEKLKSMIEKNSPYEDIYLIQPLSDLHFETNLNFDIGLKGNSKYISLFSLIAVLVLVLACINYMNLAIARSVKRASEVGLRRVAGAMPWQVASQYLGESILIAFLALILALVMASCLSPVFGAFLERPFQLNVIENINLLPWLLALVVVVGVLSGSYPAFFMASLRPILVLKGKVEGRLAGSRIQRSLMVVQYAISIALIIGSLVIYQQFRFIQNRELGYEKERIITISLLDSRLQQHFDALKNSWLGNPQIVSITTAGELPTDVTSGTILGHVGVDTDDQFNIYRARVGYHYLDLFGIELLAGRDFSPDIPSDFSETFIINETAAKRLGWTPREAVGQQVMCGDQTRTIIGVVKDFHMHSMHLEIAPLLLQMSDWFRYIAIKVKPVDLPKTLTSLEAGIREYSPYPFDYQFLDDRFDQLYKTDYRLGEMFGFFTVVSILIASMGLFGQAAFTASQRTKEMGIRKVLGASVNNIIAILSKDFLMLVLAGFIIAIPFAWYGMRMWLQDFAYRIEMEWWMFAIGGVLSMILAFLTVLTQSIKSARANPVDSLKTE